jgi:hypothetical protein
MAATSSLSSSLLSAGGERGVPDSAFFYKSMEICKSVVSLAFLSLFWVLGFFPVPAFAYFLFHSGKHPAQ